MQTTTSALISSCRTAVAASRWEEARAFYTAVIEQTHPLDPYHFEAYDFLVKSKLQRNETLGALALLRSLPNEIKGAPAMQMYLGCCLKAVGNFAEAEQALRYAAQSIVFARLQLAQLLDETNRELEALHHYFAAITSAQLAGHCLTAADVPDGARELVVHAMRRINQGRRNLFYSLLDPLLQRFGSNSLVRVRAALDMYLGDHPTTYECAEQRPTFLYIPGMPAPVFHCIDQYDWAHALNAQTDAIRNELVGCIAKQTLVEDVHQLPRNQLEQYVRSADSAHNWKAIYFFRHGEAYPQTLASCPVTAGLLESMPLSKIRAHSPEVLFSILDPGTEILPHRGVTNSRIVVHLPLIVPRDCGLEIAGHVHRWSEGQVVAFDDTFEHRAWNDSERTRVVLIADIWNPHLASEECEAIACLVQGIGEFNRECEADPLA